MGRPSYDHGGPGPGARIFINQMDSYVGRALVKAFRGKVITNAKRRAFKAVTALGAFGSITEEFSENQDAAAAVCDAADRVAEPQPEGTSTDEKDSTSGESKMEILGTLVGTPGFDVTDCTVVDNSQEAVFKALATCDYAVFSITEGPGQVVEAATLCTSAGPMASMIYPIFEPTKIDTKHYYASFLFAHSKMTVFCSTRALQFLSAYDGPLGSDSAKFHFLLISTHMTWAQTDPLGDEVEPDLPFTQDEYRQRKPHPHFVAHHACEKLAIKIGVQNAERIGAMVIATGVLYGAGEDLLHYLFRAAWTLTPELPLLGPGENLVPTMHVDDLASCVAELADGDATTAYHVVCDEGVPTLRDITSAVSGALGTGSVAELSPEMGLLVPGMTQLQLDTLLCNLRLSPDADATYLRMSWKARSGLVASIDSVVAEYREARKLQPVRIVVLGPPSSGKTTLCNNLAAHYGVRRVDAKAVIESGLAAMQLRAAELSTLATEEEMKAEADEEVKEAWKVRRADLLAVKAALDSYDQANFSRYENSQMATWFKAALRSKNAINQGYILDAFPKTEKQAEELWTTEDQGETEKCNGESGSESVALPELVVVLEATDRELHQRCINFPEKFIDGTHHTEEDLARRLAEFRAAPVEEGKKKEKEKHAVGEEGTATNLDGVLKYLNSRLAFRRESSTEDNEADSRPGPADDSHTVFVPAMRTANEVLSAALANGIVGPPRNYSDPARASADQRDAEARAIERSRAAAAATEASAAAAKTAALIAASEAVANAEAVEAERVKQADEHELDIVTKAAQDYMVQNVMPTVALALIEVSKVQPADPILFIADYLEANSKGPTKHVPLPPEPKPEAIIGSEMVAPEPTE